MDRKAPGKVLVFFSYAFGIAVSCAIFGRNTLYLGTGLHLLRWVWFLFGTVILYRLLKRNPHPRARGLVLSGLCLLLLEWGYTKISHASLKTPHGDHHLKVMTYNLYFKNKKTEHLSG